MQNLPAKSTEIEGEIDSEGNAFCDNYQIILCEEDWIAFEKECQELPKSYNIRLKKLLQEPSVFD